MEGMTQPMGMDGLTQDLSQDQWYMTNTGYGRVIKNCEMTDIPLNINKNFAMTLSCKSWTSAFWTFPVGSEDHYNRTVYFIMLRSIQEVEFENQKFILVTNLVLWQEKLWHTVLCKGVNLKLKLRMSTKLWDVMQMYKCKFTETAALVKHCLRYPTNSFSHQAN